VSCALQDARDIQLDAARVGFDWDAVSGVLDKVREEVDEVAEALALKQQEHAKSELGDLLFSAVNLARFVDADPAEELNAATRRFSDRFSRMESLLKVQGKRVSDCSLQELDAAWDRIKTS
jgi:ATP diphosphatase